MEKIKKATESFVASKKNANSLLDIFQELKDSGDDCEIILACISALKSVFLHVIEEKSLSKSFKGSGSMSKYINWLNDRYSEAQKILLDYLSHDEHSIQKESLSALISFVEAEGSNSNPDSKEKCFPHKLFSNVVDNLLSTEHDNRKIIQTFQQYIVYDDVNHHLTKSIYFLLKNHNSKNVEQTFLLNLYLIMSQIDMDKIKNEEPCINLCNNLEEQMNYNKNYSYSSKLFSQSWMVFLKLKLTNSVYKKILINIHSKVLPHLQKPLLLTDFFIESYNLGGPISLLALNGLYFLIQQYNLEYPDFYKKLYSLFEPSIFHTKYCARFFHLADIFLSSMHLPAYLVAAFVKRLSRMSLTAPVTRLFIVMPFIGNLLIRHPSLLIMVNKIGENEALDCDPYLNDEEDPSLCRAIESSLWEIKDLKTHWHPDVATRAQLVEKPLPKMEFDISEVLETSYDTLHDQEKRKKMKSCPTNFSKPIEIFASDIGLWSL